MNLNYMTSPYLRVRLADGSLAWIRPAEIAAQGPRKPVGFAFGHLLLDAFATELLIGLFQYATAPEGEDEWHDRWMAPPGVDELDELLAARADGFDLYGDTPAFQDREAASVEASPVGRLFPTSAGEQGRKRNQDIFLPDILAMRPEAAMVALAFVQAHSPAGGRGTRTSLTGGGPLRSWVEAKDGDIYRTVLANQLPR
jgi:CRISPR type I-E-associated protein CasA/Cse1